MAALMTAACADKSRPERGALTGADAGHGLEIARRVGCSACHVAPGIDWPQGAVGGSLDRFADRTLIAGRLPNRPDVLVAFLRDPPALAPSIAMPNQNLTETEARDVAAWLYSLDDR